MRSRRRLPWSPACTLHRHCRARRRQRRRGTPPSTAAGRTRCLGPAVWGGARGFGSVLTRPPAVQRGSRAAAAPSAGPRGRRDMPIDHSPPTFRTTNQQPTNTGLTDGLPAALLACKRARMHKRGVEAAASRRRRPDAGGAGPPSAGGSRPRAMHGSQRRGERAAWRAAGRAEAKVPPARASPPTARRRGIWSRRMTGLGVPCDPGGTACHTNGGGAARWGRRRQVWARAPRGRTRYKPPPGRLSHHLASSSSST